MAKHAKKRKVSNLQITLYSVLGVIFIAAWIWLLLFFPPVSVLAERFIKENLSGIFTASPSSIELGATGTSPDIEDGSNKDNEPAEEETGTGDNKTTGENAQDKESRPTIDLQIYEGPEYSASEDVCYYKVRAVVTGNPRPDVQFSRDDSNGSLGAGNARIDLKRNMTSYTLTATASNSSGTVMDSLILNWGCNSPPVISEIKVSSDIVYVSKQYTLIAKASDPDKDPISYKWTVDGGTLDSDSADTVKWNTPPGSGDYNIKVTATDSKGASSAKNIAVYVGSDQPPATTEPPVTTTTEPPATTTTEPPVTTEPQSSSFNLSKKTDEGGYLEFGGQTYSGGNLYAGDSGNNRPCVGFISFDISSLGGKTVDAATLTMTGGTESGTPLSYLDAFWINIVDWGAEPIVQGDFSLIGIAVQSFTSKNITCNVAVLKTELQKAINNGKSRFQIRVHFSGPYTDNDNSKDGWEYTQANINLNVTVR